MPTIVKGDGGHGFVETPWQVVAVGFVDFQGMARVPIKWAAFSC